MFLTQAGLVNWGNWPSQKKQNEANPIHWRKSTISNSDKIMLVHLILPFILLGVGTTAAFLVFVWELRRGKCELSEI